MQYVNDYTWQSFNVKYCIEYMSLDNISYWIISICIFSPLNYSEVYMFTQKQITYTEAIPRLVPCTTTKLAQLIVEHTSQHNQLKGTQLFKNSTSNLRGSSHGIYNAPMRSITRTFM